MSMKLLATGLATLLNLSTTPPCCTTNQRELSFGACNMATGLLKLNPANTCSKLIESLSVGRAQAAHEVLLGLASNPTSELELDEETDDEELMEEDELLDVEELADDVDAEELLPL